MSVCVGLRASYRSTHGYSMNVCFHVVYIVFFEDVYLHMAAHKHTCVCTSVRVHIHTYVHTHTYTYAHTHTYTHAHTYIHIHTYMHTYTHTCTNPQKHRHTLTHRHTNKKKSFLKQRLPCFLELDGLFSKGNAKLGKNTPRTCVLEHHGSVPERIKEDTCMEHAVFGVLFYFSFSCSVGFLVLSPKCSFLGKSDSIIKLLLKVQ